MSKDSCLAELMEAANNGIEQEPRLRSPGGSSADSLPHFSSQGAPVSHHLLRSCHETRFGPKRRQQMSYMLDRRRGRPCWQQCFVQ